MSADGIVSAQPPRVAYIGCWYKNDMYSHNCSNLVDSLRSQALRVEVVTSNCRCFSSAQQFRIAKDDLISSDCLAIAIPHAPRNPGKKYGSFKYWAVKGLRLDLILAATRGFLYYRRARNAEVIHYDQVLEAFGCIPLFILLELASVFGKQVTVTVHEIDSFQRNHRWLNRIYRKADTIFVYSENMRRQLVDLGIGEERISTIKYGIPIPTLRDQVRTQYIFFGGHHITKGKGYIQVLEALSILKRRGIAVRLLIYVGKGCNGLEDAKKLAVAHGVDDVIEWNDFFSAEELVRAYQSSKACIIPYTSGSARHPLSYAMANATPVIATRAVDIPEYLGELGIYVDGSGGAIADAISSVESGSCNLDALGKKLRERAICDLDIRKIASDIGGRYSLIHERTLART